MTRAFAAAGSAVAVVDIERERAEEAAAEAGTRGVQAVALVADVRSGEDVDAVVADAAQELGRWTCSLPSSAVSSLSSRPHESTRSPTRTGS